MNKKYNIIYADPPWKQTNKGWFTQRELDYPTLSMDKIQDVFKRVINISENNHILFCWTIDKFLHESEQMLKDLGYKIHARMIWDKTNGIAPAFTVRYSHEYLLYCYYGKMLSINKDFRGKYTTVFREQATKHSKKPLIAYEIIENLYPNMNYLELFARYKRTNWDVWGNEVESEVEL